MTLSPKCLDAFPVPFEGVEKKLPNDAELEEERNPECEQQTGRQLVVTSPLQTNDTEP